MQKLSPDDMEPCIEDLCVTWLVSYKMYLFYVGNDDNQWIDAALQNILKLNNPGPKLRMEVPELSFISKIIPSLIIQSTQKTCLNYSEHNITCALSRLSSSKFTQS